MAELTESVTFLIDHCCSWQTNQSLPRHAYAKQVEAENNFT